MSVEPLQNHRVLLAQLARVRNCHVIVEDVAALHSRFLGRMPPAVGHHTIATSCVATRRAADVMNSAAFSASDCGAVEVIKLRH